MEHFAATHPEVNLDYCIFCSRILVQKKFDLNTGGERVHHVAAKAVDLEHKQRSFPGTQPVVICDAPEDFFPRFDSFSVGSGDSAKTPPSVGEIAMAALRIMGFLPLGTGGRYE
eukprot:1320988-Amorphochlora_amoeboformis.AAC.1